MKKYEFDFKDADELKKFVESHNYYGDDSEETIEGYLACLNKTYNELCRDMSNLRRCIGYLLSSWPIEISGYEDVYSVLHGRQLEYTTHRVLIEKLITEKQEKCNHEFHEDGHNSHYTYYICNKCGLEEKA